VFEGSKLDKNYEGTDYKLSEYDILLKNGILQRLEEPRKYNTDKYYTTGHKSRKWELFFKGYEYFNPKCLSKGLDLGVFR
jgi:hypothetical protein